MMKLMCAPLTAHRSTTTTTTGERRREKEGEEEEEEEEEEARAGDEGNGKTRKIEIVETMRAAVATRVSGNTATPSSRTIPTITSCFSFETQGVVIVGIAKSEKRIQNLKRKEMEMRINEAHCLKGGVRGKK
ncbi:hypothetical protein B9Z55_025312 [Caenorhabditis nigoni]|uniref:Uncharacterized protein n=1 Tax=Caenorhabditis nigoni TaxID=1611254 RepID=A0A2G5SXU5_9PELO|nr:hypothetical protein B9Z55_025312 [Caenorhabditis nigoni]